MFSINFIPMSSEEGPNTCAWGRLYFELDWKPIWYDEDPDGNIQGFAWTFAEFLESLTRDWNKICTGDFFDIDLSKYFNGIDLPSVFVSKRSISDTIRIDIGHGPLFRLEREKLIQVLSHVADQIAVHLDTQDGEEARSVRENWRSARSSSN